MTYIARKNRLEYISHHGIKGQRWGTRNGPPYPLGNSDHSASERKAGWKSSIKGSPKIGNAYTDSEKKITREGRKKRYPKRNKNCY